MNPPWPMVRLRELLTERGETPSSGTLESGEIRIVAKIAFDTGRIEFRPDGQTRTGMTLVLL